MDFKPPRPILHPQGHRQKQFPSPNHFHHPSSHHLYPPPQMSRISINPGARISNQALAENISEIDLLSAAAVKEGDGNGNGNGNASSPSSNSSNSGSSSNSNSSGTRSADGFIAKPFGLDELDVEDSDAEGAAAMDADEVARHKRRWRLKRQVCVVAFVLVIVLLIVGTTIGVTLKNGLGGKE